MLQRRGYDGLVNQEPDRSVVVPGRCDPKVRILVVVALKDLTGRAPGRPHRAVRLVGPGRWQISPPGLDLVVKLEEPRGDDRGRRNPLLLDLCARVGEALVDLGEAIGSKLFLALDGLGPMGPAL